MVRNANVKLAAKVLGFGAIPVAVTFILAMVFAYVQPHTSECIYKNENYEDFRNHMQTVTIEEGTHCGNYIFAMDAGEYTLNLPQSYHEAVDGSDVGYGIIFKGYGYYNASLMCWLHREINGVTCIGIFDAYEFLDENSNLRYVTNIAYTDESGYVIHYYSVEETKYYEVNYDESYGYCFEYHIYVDYSLPFLYLFIATTAATIAACATAYIIKHKKQNYNF